MRNGASNKVSLKTIMKFPMFYQGISDKKAGIYSADYDKNFSQRDQMLYEYGRYYAASNGPRIKFGKGIAKSAILHFKSII